MVLTITVNPLLEKHYYFDTINSGKVNRTKKVAYRTGGKGINVSRQLNYLGIKNNALTFVGGQDGKIFRRILAEENIQSNLVSMKSDIRTGSLVFEGSKNEVTTYIGPNSEISDKEVDNFIQKMDKMIQNCSTVIFAGSASGENTERIFIEGIKLAHKYDKVSVVDTYGSHLSDCIKESPTVLHNNKNEIENSLDIKLETNKDYVNILHDFYKNDIKLAFISDGPRPIYSSKFDFIYNTEVPKIDEIDATGSGDAFVAGITYGMEKALVYENFVKYASALGVLNAMSWEVCKVEKSSIESIIDKVKIETVGKKMKIIDDTAKY